MKTFLKRLCFVVYGKTSLNFKLITRITLFKSVRVIASCVCYQFSLQLIIGSELYSVSSLNIFV